MLKLYNTLTRKKQSFKPIQKGLVRFYSCGPTVYNNVHIGNLRSFLFADLLKRVLIFEGYDVTHVMNITDVDDKTIRGAREKGISLESYTNIYTRSFHEDLQHLNIIPANKYPAATKHIEQMIRMIEILVRKKLAYQGEDGSVYFDISKFRRYGKLSKLKNRTLKAGTRVNLDEYEKDAISDFALWKAHQPEDGDIFWNSPFGKGRPGWHIECSAMATAYLGPTIDIHTGAVDLIFPHHENEIAQSEGATGKAFVKYWVHPEHLLVDGKKMSKSLKNDYRLMHLNERGSSPMDFRYLCLTAHYRAKLNFTWKSLSGARESLRRLYAFAEELDEKPQDTSTLAPSRVKKLSLVFERAFQKAIEDDLGIPNALAVLWKVVHATNKNELPANTAKTCNATPTLR